MKKLKIIAKRLLAKGFIAGQSLGVDILPRHFYSEVPFISRLKKTQSWRKPLCLDEVLGANDFEGQAEFLNSIATERAKELLKQRDVHKEACDRNGAVGFGPIESNCLYAFVFTKRPATIVQVGCGVSTALCEMAANDAGFSPRIICIDPFPTDFLVRAARENRIELISQPVEDTDISVLSKLQTGDLFFVDSTHTLGPAGEVTRITLEMLPQVPQGVFVHFHDIWLPYDYSPIIFEQPLFFWHETALLAAYLSGNNRWRVQLSLSMLHHGRPESLSHAFPIYKPASMNQGIKTSEGHFPSSIYLQTQ
ncbi:class I SAM-dependent methyltransferase [Bythopirellula polymerisocia]|uniref:Class I SAM-dependent methyltransferase n=1 Tax=Bythopirellula polymerisocia TaxID=2528003 RepID=A0A5C6CW63_9BACT|nr:class I SAM-dependent methyltransferase [Bythopirellula polymerisocia]TWU28095.1 hypothetical protein Pla144_13820 [Bythopirellula polymerisocia]